MEEYLETFFFLAFFYWPIYLLFSVMILFFVYKIWAGKKIIMRIFLVFCVFAGVTVLLPALYVVFMLIYGTIINL